MKIALRIVLLLLLVILAVPVVVVASFWMDGASVIDRAERAGALPTSADPSPPNIAERTVAASLFSDTWNDRRAPCRTFARSWGIASNSERMSGMPVSQSLSTTLLMHERREQSIRNDFRRLFVACELEQRFSDTQMLRAWLSTAYFGVEPFGIDSAARTIFGKSAAELNADEAARLTALLGAPSIRNDPDRWAARARVIAARISASAL